MNLGEKKLVEKQMGQIHDNLSLLRLCSGGTSPRAFHLSPGHALQSEWHDIKALPHQDWKAYFFFFCLQAVNYLTSTHNEQCKTSQNLIKRQRQGPSADGKWLTQLIKHPSVRLNMASLSHHLKYGWDLLHISIFSISLCLWNIYFIYYVDLYLFYFFHKGIYVSPDIFD